MFTPFLQGSVFVEFADFATVDAFLKADPKPSWNGEELLIMTKSAPYPCPKPLIPLTGIFKTGMPTALKRSPKKVLQAKPPSYAKQANMRLLRGEDLGLTLSSKLSPFLHTRYIIIDSNKFREPAKVASQPRPKREIYLQFMGTKLLVHEDGETGEGSVKEEEVPHVKGATLKFEGWEGDVEYKNVKVRLPPHFLIAKCLLVAYPDRNR